MYILFLRFSKTNNTQPMCPASWQLTTAELQNKLYSVVRSSMDSILSAFSHKYFVKLRHKFRP